MAQWALHSPTPVSGRSVAGTWKTMRMRKYVIGSIDMIIFPDLCSMAYSKFELYKYKIKITTIAVKYIIYFFEK